jgi:hypothetical protein
MANRGEQAFRYTVRSFFTLDLKSFDWVTVEDSGTPEPAVSGKPLRTPGCMLDIMDN